MKQDLYIGVDLKSDHHITYIAMKYAKPKEYNIEKEQIVGNYKKEFNVKKSQQIQQAYRAEEKNPSLHNKVNYI